MNDVRASRPHHPANPVREEVVHQDELWNVPGDLDFRFSTVDRMRTLLDEAGLVPTATTVREPYPEVEYPSVRAYLTARTRSGAAG